jgi:hypothetical protein
VVEVVVGVVQQQFLTAEASLGVILLLYRKEEKNWRIPALCIYQKQIFDRSPGRLIYR